MTRSAEPRSIKISKGSRSVDATIPLPRTFVLVQASIWEGTQEKGRIMKNRETKAAGVSGAAPIRVIDSLRYVVRSRHYSGHGTTSAHRTAGLVEGRLLTTLL